MGCLIARWVVLGVFSAAPSVVFAEGKLTPCSDEATRMTSALMKAHVAGATQSFRDTSGRGALELMDELRRIGSTRAWCATEVLVLIVEDEKLGWLVRLFAQDVILSFGNHAEAVSVYPRLLAIAKKDLQDFQSGSASGLSIKLEDLARMGPVAAEVLNELTWLVGKGCSERCMLATVKAIVSIGPDAIKKAAPAMEERAAEEERAPRDEPNSRAAAALVDAIAALGPESIPALGRLAEKNVGTAWFRLSNMGMAAAPEIARLYESGPSLRSSIRTVFKKLGPEAGVFAAEPFAKSMYQEQRRDACSEHEDNIRAMAPNNAKAVNQLLSTIQEHKQCWPEAGSALGTLGPTAVDPAMTLLARKDFESRQAAVRALAGLGNTASSQYQQIHGTYKKYLLGPYDATGALDGLATVLCALVPHNEAAPGVLVKMLSDKNPKILEYALKCLFMAGPNAALGVKQLSVIAKCVPAKDPQCKLANRAITILAEIGEAAKPAVKTIAQQCSQPMQAVASIEALRKLGPVARDAVPVLRSQVSKITDATQKSQVVELISSLQGS